MTSFTFTIEMQFAGLQTHHAARAIKRTVGGDSRGCRTFEGSGQRVIDLHGRTWDVLQTSGMFRGKLISPPLTTAEIPVLQQVIGALADAGARAAESDGFHVSVDAAPFDARAVINLSRLIQTHEPLLRHALGVTKARHALDCRPTHPAYLGRLEVMQPRTMAELNAAWFGEYTPVPDPFHSRQSCGLNLHALWSEGRIQLRYFSATYAAERIRANILFALALTRAAIETPVIEHAPPRFRPEAAREDLSALLRQIGMTGEALACAEEHLFVGLPADEQAQAQACG